MMQLSVRLVPVSTDTLVISLTGELDSTTRPVLAAFLEPLPRTSVKNVLVAAGDLWFCDLNGLEQLSITHRALQAKGGHLALAEVQPPLRRLIALMSEHSIAAFPVFDSMPEALADAGVDAYRAAPAVVGRRHLPRLRTMPRVPSAARDSARPRREPGLPAPAQPEAEAEAEAEAEQAAPETEWVIIQEPPQSDFEIGRLDTVLVQARTLREQAALQRDALVHQLTLTSVASTLMIAARERCGDTLRVMRASLSDARLSMSAYGRTPRSG